MSEFTFDSDKQGVRSHSKPKDGIITTCFKRASFGLLKTKLHVQVAQIVLVVIGGVYMFVVFQNGKPEVQPPSKELINTPQPVNRR